MPPIRRMLLATDFSASCQDAVDWACGLRERLGAERLDVVHVFDPAAFDFPAPYSGMPGADQWINQHAASMREHGQSALDALVPTLPGACQATFLEGKPGPMIVEYAREHDVDLVVVGTHGHKGLDRLVMGSVSAYVIRHAPCPVLTIKPQAAKAS